MSSHLADLSSTICRDPIVVSLKFPSDLMPFNKSGILKFLRIMHIASSMAVFIKVNVHVSEKEYQLSLSISNLLKVSGKTLHNHEHS